MFDAHLDPVKGWAPDNMSALDFSARLSANVTIDPVREGRVGHLNDDGEWEMGCVGDQMACFFFGSSDEPDSINEGSDDDQPIAGAKRLLTALVASGAYELGTTEFDTALNYLPNDSLRAIADNANATTGGRLTNAGVVKVAAAAPQNATAVCGRVSRGVKTNPVSRKPFLYFWPVHIPGATGL